MIKYKIGDFVKIRKDLIKGGYYDNILFAKRMDKFRGMLVQTTKTRDYQGNYLYCFEDPDTKEEWWLTYSMIQHPAPFELEE